MKDNKQLIMNEIESHSSVFRKVSPIQYRIRCPICGDSQKNLRDAHCYIKCGYDPTEPILFNCFKCNSSGRVTSSFLEKLGIDTMKLGKVVDKLDKFHYNRIPTLKNSDVNILTGVPVMNSLQVDYIEWRLGKGFTYEDYDRFKIVWDMDSVIQYITSDKVRNSLPTNSTSISFISDDKSMMLSRLCSKSKSDESEWRKISIYPSQNRSFYTIKSTFDLFTHDMITINIAEGVFDVMSIYKNFNGGDNSAYIATLGSDYTSGVDYAIAKGLIGTNVNVNIYIDSDIDVKYVKSQLKRYRWIFNKISIFKNILYKDIGVPIDRIKLVEYNI